MYARWRACGFICIPSNHRSSASWTSQPAGFVVCVELDIVAAPLANSSVISWLVIRPSFPSRSSSPRRALARRPSTLWRGMVATPSSYWCLVVRRPAGLCQITSLLCWHSSRSKVLLMRIRSPLAFRRNSFGFCRSHNALHYPATLPSASKSRSFPCCSLECRSVSSVIRSGAYTRRLFLRRHITFFPVLTFLFIVATGTVETRPAGVPPLGGPAVGTLSTIG